MAEHTVPFNAYTPMYEQLDVLASLLPHTVTEDEHIVSPPTMTDLTPDEKCCYILAAYVLWHCSGEIEIDLGDSEVSRGSDNGAYVQAWVWIDRQERKRLLQKLNA